MPFVKSRRSTLIKLGPLWQNTKTLFVNIYVSSFKRKIFQKQKTLSSKFLQHLDFKPLRHNWDASFCRVATKRCGEKRVLKKRIYSVSCVWGGKVKVIFFFVTLLQVEM